MKTIISIIAAVLILTACNSDSGGSKKKNNDRVGKEVNENSSKLAQAISGKAYCGEDVYENESGRSYTEVIGFLNTGEGGIVTVDSTSGETLSEDLFKWGATETKLIVVGDEGKISYRTKLEGQNLIFTVDGEEVLYSYCGDLTADGNLGDTTSKPEQSNELLVNTLLCDTDSNDKFVFTKVDSVSGSLEVHIKNEGIINGYYQIVNEDTLMINMMGVTQEAKFKRTANDEMILSFLSESEVEVQSFKICN